MTTATVLSTETTTTPRAARIIHQADGQFLRNDSSEQFGPWIIFVLKTLENFCQHTWQMEF